MVTSSILHINPNHKMFCMQNIPKNHTAKSLLNFEPAKIEIAYSMYLFLISINSQEYLCFGTAALYYYWECYYKSRTWFPCLVISDRQLCCFPPAKEPQPGRHDGAP